MSYARFSEESDVYVFLSVDGALECCGCLLDDPASSRFTTTDDMLAHLERHTTAGHSVPDYCIERLVAEKVENDEWLADFDPREAA